MKTLRLLTLALPLLFGCATEEADQPAEDLTSATVEAPPENIPAPPDVAAPPADAQRTATGLASKVLQAGTGAEKPSARDTVKVHYTGWTTDGKMFDSSLTRGEPTTFPLNRVIAGWTEGMQLMVVGEKRRFWIPEELAYKGRPGAPQGMLVFDVELLDITKAPAPPPIPDDVAGPPADALTTASGLAYKVLQPGTGDDHPAAEDTVKVHYSGWTTDGEMFDSSVVRGQPASFPLNRVIKGWTEGLQLMVVGEKRRLWIPVELAYDGAPNKPAGMLVFDVELLEITKAPEPPPVPADVAGPPADAQTTTSGLASKVLKAGTGADHPGASSIVQVHYSGWTTDGEMFDSSVMRGRPAMFPLNRVIPGWTEGLQLMVVGEKRRFWIPKELAYDGAPGKPAGMLVFDVELLDIKGGGPSPH
ncbi:MAG: FKBP-type peptidyl-prolyl cis-trans isomerase [Alphaproteobacteria bacterium]|nr:FKBP-type peptidyl-prolyl cis-trans isomerase [Alphaproteobacteria bacterium]